MSIVSNKNDDLANLAEREVIGKVVHELARTDSSFILAYADIGSRLFIQEFEKEFPDAFLETGIAEQNMISMCAAMAHEGLHVFAAAYTPFITARVLEHLKIFLGYMQAPVKILGISSGITASDLGPTHTALDDIAIMKSINNLIIFSPADNFELSKVLEFANTYNSPMYIRITSNIFKSKIYTDKLKIDIKKSDVLRKGKEIVIFSYGYILQYVLEAAKELEKQNISCQVINMHTIQPLDIDIIEKSLNFKIMITVEEHWIMGGLGSSISDYLAKKEKHPPLYKIGFDSPYLTADIPYKVLEKNKLTPEHIFQRVKQLYSDVIHSS